MPVADPDELKMELSAQIKKAADLGIVPSHLDSHHHLHTFPGYFDVYLQMAKDSGLPLRSTGYALSERITNAGIKTTQNFIGDFYDEGAELDNLLRLLLNIPDGETVEMMCHPAQVDRALQDSSSYAKKRAGELEILTTPGLEEKLEDMGYELITFRDL